MTQVRVQPDDVRYIKLGPGGGWWPRCYERSELHFGFEDEPHDEAAAGNWDATWKRWFAIRKSEKEASQDTREIKDFYTLGRNSLWVTLEAGYLWWAFAEPEVYLTDEGETATCGARYRKVIGGWSNHSVGGRLLAARNISGRLTKLAGYRRTICKVWEKSYLIRLLNDEPDPDVVAVTEAENNLKASLLRLVQKLTWQDFEVLTDLIFARGGWRRVTELGRHQKSIDLEIDHPATAERALVQVKSSAGQFELNSFVSACATRSDVRHIFFVCHTPFAALQPVATASHQVLHVWSGMSLSNAVLEAGLVHWLRDRCS
jgi:hypothetical protein